MERSDRGVASAHDQARRFEAIFESVTVGISVADLSGRMLDVNPALAAMLGYDDGELVGRSFGDITHPDDVAASLERYRDLVSGRGGPYSLEKRYVRRDGRVVWGRVNTSLVRDDRGVPLYVVTVIENVDDLKRAEERLRRAEERYRVLVEHLPLVTYVDAIDDLSSNLYTSPQVEALLGYTPEEWRADPELFVRLLHPDDRERVLEEVARTNATGDPWIAEYRLIARDGRVVWVRDEAVSVADELGRPAQSQGYLLDITARKTAEEAARASETRVRAILDGALDAVVSMDADGRIESWNANAASLFGWSAEEAIGRSLAETIVPERLRDAHTRGLERFLATGDGGLIGRRVEVTAVRRDGTEFPVELAVTAARAPDGVVFNAFVRDISERHGHEQALRESEERFRTLIENIPGVVYRALADGDWTMRFVSDDIERLTGYPAADFVGNTVRSYASIIHPDDAAAVTAIVDEGVRGHVPFVCEYRVIHADGTIRWVAEKGQPVFGRGGETLWLDGAIFDVTEQKRAEEEQARTQALLDTIVDSLPVALFLKDAHNLRFVRVNRAFEELVGLSKDEVLGRGDHAFFPAEQADFFVAKDRQTLAERTPMVIAEETIRSADGRTKSLRTVKVPILDEQGEPLYLLGITEDVTVHREAERERDRLLEAEQAARAEAEGAREQLAQQNSELRQLDHMKDEFVALVSHELRTPLTSIIGYLDLVLDEEGGPISDDQRQFLEIIKRNSNRLLRLVGDLLFVAQVDAGKLSIDLAPVDLVAIVGDSLEAARPRAVAKSIEVRLDAEPVAGVEGDRVRLAQLLDNLVSNAIKFTPHGGRVGIRVHARDGNAVLTVSDTGIGIAAADQLRLFERFFRAEGASRLAIQGTGLGLTISQAIATAHGGSITVESEEGRGTTFEVTLPIAGGASGALAA